MSKILELAKRIASTGGLETKTTETISGTYDSTGQQRLLSHAYTIGANLTITNGELILSRLANNGTDMTLEFGSDVTLTGDGMLMLGELGVGQPNQDFSASRITGKLPSTIFSAGHVLQVVSFLTEGRGNVSIGQTDTALNPSIEKTITPKGTGSSFFIKIRWIGESQDANASHAHIHRDGIRINAINSSNTPNFDFHLGNPIQSYHGSDFDSTLDYLNFATLDKAGSTAGTDITFKLMMSSGGTKSVWTNRCAGVASYAGGNSEIIIMEIAG